MSFTVADNLNRRVKSDAQSARSRNPQRLSADGSMRVRHTAATRRAMTLLEVLLASTLMSVVSISGALALRTSWQAREIQDLRSDRLQHLSGVLSHITRNLRKSRGIVEVSDATDSSGYLAITLPDDSVVKWDHDIVDLEVRYGPDPPTDLLGMGIDSLTFECFEIDGVTPTTVPADIRMIRTAASVTIPVQGAPFALTSTVWIRRQQDALAPEFIDFYATQVKNSPGWDSPADSLGPPDGVFSEGDVWANTTPYGCDTTEYSGSVGTVVVGLYLKTDSGMDGDFMDVQVRLTDPGTPGPTHSFSSHALLRYVNNLDWFWIEVTDDLGPLTYADVSDVYVEISNRQAGAGGATIFLDSVVVRTFEPAPITQTFWLTADGTWNQEWRARGLALDAPDGQHARSDLTYNDDIDRQAYFHTGSWQDDGTIVRVRLRIFNFFLDVPFVDDQFQVRFPLPTESSEPNDTPVPNTAYSIPLSVLNAHVGVANQGTVIEDFTYLQDWTWPDLNSRYVRLYGTAVGTPDGGDIKVDAVGVEVRYVPPTQAAVVLWEEL